MLPIKDYIKDPRILLLSILREYGGWIPDRHYLQMLFFLKMGKRLNLDNPQTFSEKMQWLKLYNRKQEYTTMVDKLLVKNYVANIIGAEYIVPTLEVWKKPEKINFDNLPDQFVLKTTHGGGSCGAIVCKDKKCIDKDKVVKKLCIAMRQDIYNQYREWPYKNVMRQIIAEKYIENQKNSDMELIDYKFYCFNGEPKFCQVIRDRSTKETIDFFDMDWHHQEFYGLNPIARPAVVTPLKPIHFLEMQKIAHDLSQGLKFCRIDIYDTIEQPYFGEITLYPASGLGTFTPSKYDKILGGMIKLH